MYESHYGFKQRPFQLLPNPDYLFLSRSHEEALAHLTYAMTHGDGFVAIIGEVGTGKTTICRSFLENLDPSIEAAYIFNPKMDSKELLRAINDEFGIRSDADSIKDLIDTLNVYLIEKKKEGKRVIIIIDEAQNLSREVLEQLRLTSNLETTTGKLIQIVLVGQPELADLLHSHELRQLAQRISLSSHLVPLTEQETRDYIRYRLARSAHRPTNLFSTGACRLIFQYSRGIPRLINIACDRALIVGFGLSAPKITGKVASQAIDELKGQGKPQEEKQAYLGKRVALLVLLFLFLVLALVYYPEWRPRNSSLPEGTASLTGADRGSDAEAGKTGPDLNRLKQYPKEEMLHTKKEGTTASRGAPPEPADSPGQQQGRMAAEKPHHIQEEVPAAPAEEDLETSSHSGWKRRESVEQTFRTPEELLFASEKPVEEMPVAKGTKEAKTRNPN